MDKDRVNGAFRQAEGALRQAADKISGKVHNMATRETGKVHSMGGMKDALRDQNSGKTDRF